MPDEPIRAFPSQTSTLYIHGMTLRDYFAARAMAAMIPIASVEDDPSSLARRAYAVADAMLFERKGS